MAYADLSALSTRLGFSDSLDDGLLAAALTSAEAAIDSWCRRTFVVPAAVSTRTFLPWGQDLVVDDIATTVGLIVVDDTATLDNADLVLDPPNGVGPDGRDGWPYWRIRYADGSWWTRDANRRTVSVTAKFGWAAVPVAVKEATLVLASDLFHAKDTRLGVAGFGEFGIIRIRENGLLQSLLANYVRPAGPR
jgi:hypothetical protein